MSGTGFGLKIESDSPHHGRVAGLLWPVTSSPGNTACATGGDRNTLPGTTNLLLI
jgi:hypothetical protein